MHQLRGSLHSHGGRKQDNKTGKMKRTLELEVICGTYEEFVVGYQLYTYSGDKPVAQFEQSFADHSHTASVRSVACHGDVLASGGADEIVKLYNMRRRTEMGQLMDHQGTITCLQFHGRHHLLSGSEDGRVAVVRVDNWICEKHLGRHPGGVTALAVHPSGRLALTAGKDRKLLTWDLVRGRVAFRTNLKTAAEFVVWSPDGSTYAVGVQGRCDVYSVATAGVLHSLKTASKINCAAYLSETLLAVGSESGEASVFDVSADSGSGSGGRGVSWAAHKSRLRACTAVRRSETQVWLVTASSDGLVKVWETPVSEMREPSLVASYDTTCRLTSVTLHVPPEKRWPPAEPATEPAVQAAVQGQRTAAQQEASSSDESEPDEVEDEDVEEDGEDSLGEEESGGEESDEPAPRPQTKRKRSETTLTSGGAIKTPNTKKRQALKNDSPAAKPKMAKRVSLDRTGTKKKAKNGSPVKGKGKQGQKGGEVRSPLVKKKGRKRRLNAVE